MKSVDNKLSLYIHIPFCMQKCFYCDFLSAPSSGEVRERYVKRLLQEIKEESGRYKKYKITTVFFGGGTPSILEPGQILRIMRGIRDWFELEDDCEISIEVNPGSASVEKIKAWREAGFNRVSIGFQSLEDGELRALGRIHNRRECFQTYESLVKTGFNNINIDLMTAIPGQTMESCLRTLKTVTALAPAHISVYSLILEEGTPFFQNPPVLPDEDTEREMYKMTNDVLSAAGYERYEISNYAKDGYACRHNQVYWQRGNYAGFGTGAASLIENVRFHNGSDLDTYLLKGPQKEDVCQLSLQEQMEEFMFLGLRMQKGVSEEEFRAAFDKSVDQVYPGIVTKYVENGLLRRVSASAGQGGKIALTERGIDVSNVVMADFLLT